MLTECLQQQLRFQYNTRLSHTGFGGTLFSDNVASIFFSRPYPYHLSSLSPFHPCILSSFSSPLLSLYLSPGRASSLSLAFLFTLRGKTLRCLHTARGTFITVPALYAPLSWREGQWGSSVLLLVEMVASACIGFLRETGSRPVSRPARGVRRPSQWCVCTPRLCNFCPLLACPHCE